MRQTKRLLSLMAVVLIAACTDNSIFNPMTDFSGTYQLTVFAGHMMPASYTYQPGSQDFPNGGTFVVDDGTLVLNSNGTFVETNHFTTTETGGSPQPSSFISTGTWTSNGTEFTLFSAAQDNTLHRTRNVSGTIDFDTQDRATVFYQEDDGSGTGTVESYEYKRP